MTDPKFRPGTQVVVTKEFHNATGWAPLNETVKVVSSSVSRQSGYVYLVKVPIGDGSGLCNQVNGIPEDSLKPLET